MKKFLTIVFSFVFVFLTFVPYAAAVDNVITEINITVPIPQIGDKIPFHDDITVDNENCRIGLIGWVSEKNGFAQSEVFLPDLHYTLLLSLDTADNNYVFADNCKVTVNGNPAKCAVLPSGNSISVEYDFGIPESSSDSNISFLEIIKGYIQEILERISQMILSIFGFIIY